MAHTPKQFLLGSDIYSVDNFVKNFYWLIFKRFQTLLLVYVSFFS